jgi:hypothetical protein
MFYLEIFAHEMTRIQKAKEKSIAVRQSLMECVCEILRSLIAKMSLVYFLSCGTLSEGHKADELT